MAFTSLRISPLSNPTQTSASISVSRNSIVRQRSPSRRRSRCRRIRWAAAERAAGLGGLAFISVLCGSTAAVFALYAFRKKRELHQTLTSRVYCENRQDGLSGWPGCQGLSPLVFLQRERHLALLLFNV